jgi:hypothetical protein
VIIPQIPQATSPRRFAKFSVNRMQIEQRLPGAGGFHDQPERLADPLRVRWIIPGLFEIKAGKRAQVLNDPIRVLS